MRALPLPSIVFLALTLVTLTSCGKADSKSYEAQNPSSIEMEETAKMTPSLVSSVGLGTPAWGNKPAWNNVVLKVVNARFNEFNKAKDVEVFCPGYRRASKQAQMHCWVMLAAAISKFESAFKPETSFREPDGNYSIGLLALSPGECPNASTHKSLQHAEANLICGMNRMAALIGKYGNIDGPEHCRGASRYWSTLRAPYKRWDPTRKRHLNLGKRNLILPLTKGYRGTGAGREIMDLEEMDSSVDELDLDVWEPREL